jgi:hypothetical protein
MDASQITPGQLTPSQITLGQLTLGQLTPGSASETLDSLAQQFQQLPVASLAPALVLVLGGALLLIAGRHFLRPVLVVMTVLFGAMLGPSILGGVLPRFGSVFLAFLGGLSGLIFVAIAWRLVLGAATGVIAAFACALLAMLAVDAGLIDARSPVDARTPVDAPPAVSVDAHAVIIDRAPAIVHPLVHWADARWFAEAPQVRTLLGAAAMGGGFIGFVLGAWLTASSAALLTSMAGSIFMLVGAMPFLARYSDRAAQGVHPVGWLLLWLALSIAGWLFQTWRGDETDHASKPARA